MKIPSGERWHSELLISMFTENNNRKAVLDKSLQIPLTDYMGFRHFFRHSYGYHLRWDLAQPLFENIHDTWDSIKAPYWTLSTKDKVLSSL